MAAASGANHDELQKIIEIGADAVRYLQPIELNTLLLNAWEFGRSDGRLIRSSAAKDQVPPRLRALLANTDPREKPVDPRPALQQPGNPTPGHASAFFDGRFLKRTSHGFETKPANRSPQTARILFSDVPLVGYSTLTLRATVSSNDVTLKLLVVDQQWGRSICQADVKPSRKQASTTVDLSRVFINALIIVEISTSTQASITFESIQAS